MGSLLSLYLSKKHYKHYYVDIAILDTNSSSSPSMCEMQNECNDFSTDFRTFSVLEPKSTLYYYSVNLKNVNEFLTRTKKYLSCVNKVIIVGDDSRLMELAKHFDSEKLNMVDLDEVTKRMKLVSRLENFADSSTRDVDHENMDSFALDIRRTICEDHIVVHFESGVTYYYVPLGEEPAKFLGHSPIGTETALSLFRLFVKNFGSFLNQYNDCREFNFDQLFALSETGSNVPCDILVSDIYGEDSTAIKLPPFIAASRLGKIQTPNLNEVFKKLVDNKNGLKDKIEKIEDFACSLMMMFVENVAQNVILRSRIHECTSLLFVGSVFRNKGFCMMMNKKSNFYRPGVKCSFSDVNTLFPLVASLDV